MRPLLAYVRAHHVGLLALLVVLSGSAYAATQITSKQIKNKTIQGKDLKPKTLTGKQFKDGSLKGGDAADGSLAGADFTEGAVTGSDIDEASLNAARIVGRLRDPSDQPIPRNTSPVFVQLNDTASWPQRADEVNTVVGRFTVAVPAGCNPNRNVQMFVLRPGSNFPTSASGVVGVGFVQSNVAGAQTLAGSITSSAFFGASDPDSFEPGADTSRSLIVRAVASCAGGSTADPVLTDLDLDVVGYR